jgi:hypothetical protein
MYPPIKFQVDTSNTFLRYALDKNVGRMDGRKNGRTNTFSITPAAFRRGIKMFGKK